LSDTLRRIPFGTIAHGVFDNMVEVKQFSFLRTQRRDWILPLATLDPRPNTPQQVVDLLIALLVEMQIPTAAAVYFATRMAVFMSSCDARRLGEWEKIAWTEFIATKRFGQDYRKTLGALPEFTQASKAENTSAKYVAWVFMNWILYPLLGRGTNGPVLRMLNAPTNEAWIDPWLAQLRSLGVRLRLQHEVVGWRVRDGRIAGARVRTPHSHKTVTADYYVCGLPVERARRLWSPAVLRADPKLAEMHHLGVTLMNGIMLYLKQRSAVVGGAGCADSPWSLTFVPQAQLWPADFASTYGDGTVRDKLSVSIADFNSPGVLYGKSARDCTREEIAREVWEQIKQHVNNPGQAPQLTDEMLHSWDLDPGLKRRRGRMVSEDPLILPTAGTEKYRPAPTTALPNLVLCGDYLNGEWETTNMEAASYNARRAANAIIEAAGSRESAASVIGSYRPPEWEPLKRIDQDRYRRGQANVFDADLSSDQVKQLLGRAGVNAASAGERWGPF
jgi:uncharacterized protein with NAD-binding domain and iron-sulfur cluster